MIDLTQQLHQWDTHFAENHPVRVTRKQKRHFLATLESELQILGYTTQRQTRRYLLSNENLLTECEHPRIIFLAHYDTPTIIPFWFSWLFRLFGHTRQIMAFFVLLFLLNFIFSAPIVISNAVVSTLFIALQIIIMVSFVAMLIPNPSNREDNTSGVLAVLALADWLKDKPALKKQVQFAILDNEELGLLGSNALKQAWDKEAYPYKEASIIVLDCVSLGEMPLVVYHKHDELAHRVLPFVQTAFPQAQSMNMGILPLSDNYTFKRQGAIDISFFDKTLIPGGYYIPNIHTPADKVFRPGNLTPLIQSLTQFITAELTTGDLSV